jgi:hypothetical protein
MRKIVLVNTTNNYSYENDNYLLASVIPVTDWIEVSDEEYNTLFKATKYHKSSIYGAEIIELLDSQKIIPKMKTELLAMIEEEKKEEAERKSAAEKHKEEKRQAKLLKDKKKAEKLYQQLKKEFEGTV